MKRSEFYENLTKKIELSYTESVTLPEAEKLASEFLHAQIVVSGDLKRADLNSRMRKSGVKALRAAIYLDKAQSSEKKPTEAALAAMIDSDDLVKGEQNELDNAEVERDELERYYSIFNNAHVFFRGIAKGTFGA